MSQPPARGDFRIMIGCRRIGWLPAVWPNRIWFQFESPPGSAWDEAYDLAVQFSEVRSVFRVDVGWAK